MLMKSYLIPNLLVNQSLINTLLICNKINPYTLSVCFINPSILSNKLFGRKLYI